MLLIPERMSDLSPPVASESSTPVAACCLSSSLLTPDLLATNLRAGLFPFTGERIRNNIHKSLANQAWMEVQRIERRHQKHCNNIKVMRIHPLYTLSDSSSSSSYPPPSPSFSLSLPLPARVYAKVFSESSAPHLSTFKPSDLSSASSPSVVYHSPLLLGCELWSLDRCQRKVSYVLSYYSQGDMFYANVLPTDWSSTYDCLRSKLQRWL